MDPVRTETGFGRGMVGWVTEDDEPNRHNAVREPAVLNETRHPVVERIDPGPDRTEPEGVCGEHQAP